MKVAYLLGSLNRGGTETLLLDCLQQADIISYNVVALYRKDGILSSAFQNIKFKLIKLTPSFVGDIRYFFRLRKLLNEEGVDIVHAQQPIDALYGKVASIGCRRKIILTFHGFDFSNSILDKILYRLALKLTDCNIFVSNAQKKYYEKKYNNHSIKNCVVYNGIAFSKFDEYKPVDIRKELNLTSDNLLLAMVGSFVSVRDQLTICRFLDKINQQGINFHFLFVGKMDDAAPSLYNNCVDYCLSHNLSSKVSFLGVRDDVPAILSQLDAFIYASHHDTFGIAVIEAIAAGIPVFVNDWEVMTEITENGKLALLYKTKNEDDLANKFSSFIENKTSYRMQAKQSAKEVRKKYSIENHINSLYTLYKSINARQQ